VAELGQPFDFNTGDLEGPHAHNSNYGKRPELVTIPSGTGLDVLMRDQTKEKTAYVNLPSVNGGASQKPHGP
jgi:hypothetical protein